MNDGNQESVRSTRPPTPAEEFWFDYSQKLPSLSREYLTTFADKLLSLSTAAIAAYIAAVGLTKKTFDWYLWIPIGCFFGALFSALCCLYPKGISREYTSLKEIRQRYLSGLRQLKRAVSVGLVLYSLSRPQV